MTCTRFHLALKMKMIHVETLFAIPFLEGFELLSFLKAHNQTLLYIKPPYTNCHLKGVGAGLQKRPGSQVSGPMRKMRSLGFLIPLNASLTHLLVIL